MNIQMEQSDSTQQVHIQSLGNQLQQFQHQEMQVLAEIHQSAFARLSDNPRLATA